ncbi:hypothetical protein EXU57_02755 [Segetibacter sp. 3557_3]|uniref:hypothetical protein n=1 Tax=Segetibacter sp. 3557_3 TaxID=2547429 RepID=UPI0010586768|nr:hypothetical protein [Segetibacter sp. 3557_3]TDH29011.1 hypothetical protein EXU57_02755 [Segetibacter sp. 3557_3]
MILYYDFEGRRMHAEVYWPSNADTIQVQLVDKRLKQFPTDLLYDKRGSKISFHLENPRDKRLTELQTVIGKRLQEIASQEA